MNCKGSIHHGTGCAICPSCEKEKSLLEAKRPVSLLVTESTLDQWDSVADDKQLREIIRLARAGLWAERYQAHIVVALTKEMGKQPRGSISPFERALDALPGRKP